jgi:group I intron endonuclease
MNNPTTFCIYRIVCFQTGKVYIGQSKQVKRRQADHFWSLRRKQHHNQKLQAAYNKYGRNSFYSEIIETNISADKIDEREIHWIAFYDSFQNGYNMTSGGQISGGNFKTIELNGSQYVSKQAASDATGLTIREIDVHLNRRRVQAKPYKKEPARRQRTIEESRVAPTKEELTAMAIRLGLLKP